MRNRPPHPLAMTATMALVMAGLARAAKLAETRAEDDAPPPPPEPEPMPESRQVRRARERRAAKGERANG